jgi:hypothetical protein
MLHAPESPGILVLLLLLAAYILTGIALARGGRQLFIRRIPGLSALDEAIGRATEMGRPAVFHFGVGLGQSQIDIVMIQSLLLALHVLRMAARFGTRMLMTTANPTFYATLNDAARETYDAAGRPEMYDVEEIRFLSNQQFAYASGCVGLMHRERPAASFMFGYWYAESLILAEAGNEVGAIQVAGTPTITQIPFFVAACDYTIIGDEYYAGTAYLTREPVLLGSVVGQDWGKMTLALVALLGVLAATSRSLRVEALQKPAAATLSWFEVKRR